MSWAWNDRVDHIPWCASAPLCLSPLSFLLLGGEKQDGPEKKTEYWRNRPCVVDCLDTRYDRMNGSYIVIYETGKSVMNSNSVWLQVGHSLVSSIGDAG